MKNLIMVFFLILFGTSVIAQTKAPNNAMPSEQRSITHPRPMKSYLKGLSKGFHTYGFEWTPEKYAFFIDGYKFHKEKQGVSNIAEYMILSMELHETVKSLEKTIFPDVFLVDYVKVYQKP